MMPNVNINGNLATITISDGDILKMIVKGFPEQYKEMVKVVRTETGYKIVIDLTQIINRINNDFKENTKMNEDLVKADNTKIELTLNRNALIKIISTTFNNAKVVDLGDKFQVSLEIPSGGFNNPLMGFR